MSVSEVLVCHARGSQAWRASQGHTHTLSLYPNSQWKARMEDAHTHAAAPAQTLTRLVQLDAGDCALPLDGGRYPIAAVLQQGGHSGGEGGGGLPC